MVNGAELSVCRAVFGNKVVLIGVTPAGVVELAFRLVIDVRASGSCVMVVAVDVTAGDKEQVIPAVVAAPFVNEFNVSVCVL
jgi:hypothetical protein